MHIVRTVHMTYACISVSEFLPRDGTISPTSIVGIQIAGLTRVRMMLLGISPITYPAVHVATM
jgi:hypothetical protein